MAVYLALRCCACGMFQVKQQKKSSNKWSCSICNEKQSVVKVYGRSGVAKDIRQLVQGLNYSKHIQDEEIFANGLRISESMNDNEDWNAGTEFATEDVDNDATHANNQCKWAEFLGNQESPSSCEPSCDGDEDKKYVTALPEVRGRKGKTRKYQAELADSTRSNDVGSKRIANANARFAATTIAADTVKRASRRIEKLEPVVFGRPYKQMGIASFLASDHEQKSKRQELHAGGLEKENAPAVTNQLDPLQTTPSCNDAGTRILPNSKPSIWSKYMDPASQSEKLQSKPSKWNEYLEDGTDLQNHSQASSRTSLYDKWSTLQQSCTYAGEIKTELEDEIVTDDIHPSFLQL